MNSRNKTTAYSYIRFSTPEQLKGDSLRRQKDLSLEYARKHGLELDDTLNLRDLGVSAFRGKNRTAGALAGFFKAIDAGTVRPGSYLLVESLDRLSRAQITEALPAFLQIINAGIRVVTLVDNMCFDKQSLDQNIGNLMMSLVVMARAHEESATKSKRLAAAWSEKRARIQDRKLTALAPAWLELEPDSKSFRVIPERKKLIRRIFSLVLQGYGKRQIAKRFNSEGIEPWGKGKRKGNGWHESYIQKLLNTRAVLGEYQPCRLIEKKRVPEGPAILDYFPRVIDEETFNRVKRKPGGYTGSSDRVSNLFTKIVFDGYTGAPMHFADKGTKKRGNGKWRYLVSDHSRIKPDSKRCSWAYYDFESLMMSNVVEIDWKQVAQEGDHGECEEITFLIGSLERELSECNFAIQRLLSALESSEEPPATIVSRMREQEQRRESLLDRIAHQQALKEDMEKRNSLLQLSETDMKRAVENIHDLSVRRKLREDLRLRIRRIDLYPNGLQQNMSDGTHTLHICTLYKAASITFINGVVRWVLPLPGSSEVFCWHVIPTPNGAKFALAHGINFTSNGICETIKFPPEVRVMFAPVHSGQLIAGDHSSVAGLPPPVKVADADGPDITITPFTPPEQLTVPEWFNQ